jgi:hypothetical protein
MGGLDWETHYFTSLTSDSNKPSSSWKLLNKNGCPFGLDYIYREKAAKEMSRKLRALPLLE